MSIKIEELQVGDRVRITLDMEVSRVDSDGEVLFHENDDVDLGLYPGTDAVVKIEEAPERVTVFGDGDLVVHHNWPFEGPYLLLSGRRVYNVRTGTTSARQRAQCDSSEYRLLSSAVTK